MNGLLPESQPNKNIFESFDNFIGSINLENWIFLYIFFELNLIKDLGYDPNLDKHLINNNGLDTEKIKIDTFTYDIPKYLILKKLPDNTSNHLIRKSLYFTRNIIQNKFYIPYNLPFPKSRILLETYFN